MSIFETISGLTQTAPEVRGRSDVTRMREGRQTFLIGFNELHRNTGFIFCSIINIQLADCACARSRRSDTVVN